MNPDDFETLLRTRRSIRKFKNEPLSQELLGRLLSAAVQAPSASNKQPWRFLVITSRSLLSRMAAAVRTAVEEVAAHIPPESEPAFRSYGDYFTRFEQAPAVIVVVCRASTILSNLAEKSLPTQTRAQIEVLEETSGMVSAALAVENLLLAAHALGLGASGMTGPLLAGNSLAELLGVQPSWRFVAFVPVGYPDETPSPTERKSWEKVTRWFHE